MTRRVDPRAALFVELVSAADLSVRVGQETLTRAGVDPYAFLVLAYVGELEPVAPSRLSRVRGIGRTTLRDAVRRLAERGEVERVPSATDRRSQLVRLTPAGRSRLEAGLRALERAGERLEDALGAPLDDHLERIEELASAFRELAKQDRRNG